MYGLSVAVALVAVAAAVAVVVMMIVMAAVGRVAGLQRAREQRLDRRVGVALHAAVNPDAEALERHLCAAADAAADHVVHAVHHQEARQQAVAAARRIEDLRSDDLAALDLVELKLGAVAKVLKNLSVVRAPENALLFMGLYSARTIVIPSVLRCKKYRLHL